MAVDAIPDLPLRVSAAFNKEFLASSAADLVRRSESQLHERNDARPQAMQPQGGKQLGIIDD